MKLTVWTKAYRPFIMGGDVNGPISTEVEVGDAVELGHGFKAHVVVSPTGETYVAEATTGAFVGGDIKQVKADVASADPEVMREQIEKAAIQAKKADCLSNEDFWSLFRA